MLNCRLPPSRCVRTVLHLPPTRNLPSVVDWNVQLKMLVNTPWIIRGPLVATLRYKMRGGHFHLHHVFQRGAMPNTSARGVGEGPKEICLVNPCQADCFPCCSWSGGLASLQMPVKTKRSPLHTKLDSSKPQCSINAPYAKSVHRNRYHVQSANQLC